MQIPTSAQGKGGKKEVREQGLQLVAKKRTNLHPDKEAKAFEDVGNMCLENGLSN